MIVKDKNRYRKVYSDTDIPIQLSPEWMDAVCVKGSWGVIMAFDNENNLDAVLVYHERSFLGMRFILMPSMCFYNGLFIIPKANQNNYQKISRENKLTCLLLEALPPFSFYYQQLHPSMQNLFELEQENFALSTRYTYRISLAASNLDAEKILKPATRRNINKASEYCVIERTDMKTFWSSLDHAYSNRSNPFNKNILFRLSSAFEPEENIQLFLCRDKRDSKVLAGSMIAVDNLASYYVCGFYVPEKKKLAGLSYLLWHNIKSNKRPCFDFEGSMIRPIEYFFRSFGAELVPHHRIWKFNNKIIQLPLKYKFRKLLR